MKGFITLGWSKIKKWTRLLEKIAFWKGGLKRLDPAARSNGREKNPAACRKAAPPECYFKRRGNKKWSSEWRRTIRKSRFFLKESCSFRFNKIWKMDSKVSKIAINHAIDKANYNYCGNRVPDLNFFHFRSNLILWSMQWIYDFWLPIRRKTKQ